MDNLPQKNAEEAMKTFDRQKKINLCQQHHRRNQMSQDRHEVEQFEHLKLNKIYFI